MKLTDNEKQGILKLIEAGKPLPDKNRFFCLTTSGKWLLSGTARQMKSRISFGPSRSLSRWTSRALGAACGRDC